MHPEPAKRAGPPTAREPAIVTAESPAPAPTSNKQRWSAEDITSTGGESWLVEIISPEAAARALENVIDRQRSLDKQTLLSYARDMATGHWKMTGDPVRFNKSGQLFDGQHRMAACVHANTPFVSMVGRNLDDDLINVIDSGRKRRPGDILAMRGVPQGHLVSASCKWLTVFSRLLAGDGMFLVFGRVSHEEILSMYDRHPGLSDSSRLVANKAHGIRPSLLTTVHYLGKAKLGKGELADAFLETFTTGRSYYGGSDPALRLREKNLRAGQRGQTFDNATALGNAVTAWNAFQARRPLRAIVAANPPFIDGLTAAMIHG